MSIPYNKQAKYIMPWDASQRELSPCPFCGCPDIILSTREVNMGEKKPVERYTITCGGCYASKPMNPEYKSSAYIEWNMRLPPKDGVAGDKNYYADFNKKLKIKRDRRERKKR